MSIAMKEARNFSFIAKEIETEIKERVLDIDTIHGS